MEIMNVNNSVDLILSKFDVSYVERLKANVDLTIKTPGIFILFILNLLAET
jgi:hypothetical protein